MKQENFAACTGGARPTPARKALRPLLGLICVSAMAVYAVAGTPTWNYLSASNLGYSLFRGGSTTVYDPVSNELIVFSGFSQDQSQGNPHVNDVWALSNANGLGGAPAWTNLIANGAAGAPAGRHNASAVYDSVNNRMIVYGGCTGGCLPLDNGVYVLTNANGQGGTPAWQQLSPSGAPPGRSAHVAVYDSSTNTMIIFGGQNGGGFCGGYNDVWTLSNANGLGGPPAWTQLSPTGSAPLGDYFASAAYDPNTNSMMVFGGSIQGNSCNQNETNDTYVLSHANGAGGTPAWTKLRPASKPPVRESTAMVYNPASNRLTVFGGINNSSGLFADTWVLSNANGTGGTPVWAKVTPAKPASPPFTPTAATRFQCSGFDSANDRMIITGLGNSNSDGPMWTTWALSDADNQ
jgi:hypothetical protein